MAYQDRANYQFYEKMRGLFEYFWRLTSRRTTNSFGLSQHERPPLQIYQQFPDKCLPRKNVSVASLLGVTSLPSALYRDDAEVSELNSQNQHVLEDDSVALLLKDTSSLSSLSSTSFCSPGVDYPFGVSVSEPTSQIKHGIDDTVTYYHFDDDDDTARKLYLSGSSLRSYDFPESLEDLHITNCMYLEFPPPHKFPLLDILCINSSCESLVHFPLDLFRKLSCLSLRGCPNLVSLSVSGACLPALEVLEIWDCPKLTSFPEAGLPTPNLQYLWLSNCRNLIELPNNSNSFTHLQFLVLRNCPNLGSFPTLSTVMSLSIFSCDKLIPKKEWGLHNLLALTKFEIEGEYPSLETFPEEGLLPSGLICLRVGSLSSLTTLGSGISHLTCLQTLEIDSCPKLYSLSVQCLPSSLNSLSIENCPKIDTETLGINIKLMMEMYERCKGWAHC